MALAARPRVTHTIASKMGFLDLEQRASAKVDGRGYIHGMSEYPTGAKVCLVFLHPTWDKGKGATRVDVGVKLARNHAAFTSRDARTKIELRGQRLSSRARMGTERKPGVRGSVPWRKNLATSVAAAAAKALVVRGTHTASEAKAAPLQAW